MGFFAERLWAFSLLLALRLVLLDASLARHAAPAAVSTQVQVHLKALRGTLIWTSSEVEAFEILKVAQRCVLSQAPRS